MNSYAIQHIIDSSYCFPISENEMVIRLRTAKNDIENVWIIYENKYEFGSRQKKKQMKKSFEGELFDYFTIKLQLEDTRFAYVFYVDDGEQQYFYSEDGITETYNFEKGYYNFFQYPYINKIDVMPYVDWMKHAVFYQIFIDRFNMADTKKSTDYINAKWSDIPNSKTFMGGDLKGITVKLPYLKELGINAVYLTPIFKSKSNHKYDISDYMQIDDNFGSNEDFNELIDNAHKLGIRIVLDAVFNHCSDEMEEFQDVIKNGRNSKYYDWFIIHGEKPDQKIGNYEMFASCSYMPKFNTSNNEVQQYLIKIACYYIEKYNIDGWRLDVSDEVSHDFWKNFRKAVKDSNHEAVIIGENWHDASNYLRGDQYDSIMNYAFTKSCLDYFATESKNAKVMAFKLNEILIRNTDTVNAMMLNLLDSHDTHRFFSEIGEGREKMKAALCLLFLFPGVPCIYYGTEILMQGGYDPDCRRSMDWEKTESEEYKDIYHLIRTLSEIRHTYDLNQGIYTISAQNNILMLRNEINLNIITLYINNSEMISYMDGHTINAYSHKLLVSGGNVTC